MRKLRDNLELLIVERSRNVRKDICILVRHSPLERDTTKEVSQERA